MIGLALVAYLIYRSRSSSSSQFATSPTGTAASPTPSTGSGGDQGAGAASPDAALLAALAGENQDLMKSFLASEQGLVSLLGSSLGSTTANQPIAQTSQVGSKFGASTPVSTSTPVAPLAPATSSTSLNYQTAQIGPSVDVGGGGQPGSYTPSTLESIQQPLGTVYETSYYDPNAPFGGGSAGSPAESGAAAGGIIGSGGGGDFSSIDAAAAALASTYAPPPTSSQIAAGQAAANAPTYQSGSGTYGRKPLR